MELKNDYIKVIFYKGRERVLELNAYNTRTDAVEAKCEDESFLKEKGITQIAVIVNDNCEESPREWDNAGTIISLVTRNFYSDKDAYPLYRNIRENFYQDGKFDYNREEIGGQFVSDNHSNVLTLEREKVIFLPIYMYSHSGETIKTSPFTCRWDSGLVGYIYMTATKAKEEGFTRKDGKIDWKRVKGILEAEVKIYDSYIRGECYGFNSFKVEDGIVSDDSEDCYGFLGDDALESMEDAYLPRKA